MAPMSTEQASNARDISTEASQDQLDGCILNVSQLILKLNELGEPLSEELIPLLSGANDSAKNFDSAI